MNLANRVQMRTCFIACLPANNSRRELTVFPGNLHTRALSAGEALEETSRKSARQRPPDLVVEPGKRPKNKRMEYDCPKVGLFSTELL